MGLTGVLQSVAAQINAGALGPDVTAEYRGPNGNGHKPDIDAGELPESLLERLRSHYGETDGAYWAMGDDIDEAVVESSGRLTQNRVWAIAAKEMNISLGEVKVLHQTAANTDQSLRGEYENLLTHSHFREVRFIHDRAEQRDFLQWCIDTAEDWGGRVATAARLRKHIKQVKGETKPDPTAGELIERGLALLDRARDTDDSTFGVLHAVSSWLDRVALDEQALGAAGELRMAASEVREAARAWGKTPGEAHP